MQMDTLLILQVRTFEYTFSTIYSFYMIKIMKILKFMHRRAVRGPGGLSPPLNL